MTVNLMDFVSKGKRSAIMRGVKPLNTKPEIRVRSLLHRFGYRFRIHVAGLPGKPDIVLRKHNVVIFVHGCFWHQHSFCREGQRRPTSNMAFWNKKFAANLARDKKHEAALRGQGWRVVVIWECEVRDDKALAKAVRSVFSSRPHVIRNP